jgi:hypothetical protein
MASYIWRDYELDKVYVKSDAGEKMEVPKFVDDAYRELAERDTREYRKQLYDLQARYDAQEKRCALLQEEYDRLLSTIDRMVSVACADFNDDGGEGR